MLRYFKNVATDSFIYGLSSLSANIIGFLLLPLYMRFLSQEDFGLVAIFVVVTPFIVILNQLGLAHALFRFYYRQDVDQKKVIATSLTTTIVLAIITGTALILYPRVILDILNVEVKESTLLMARFVILSSSVTAVSDMLVNILRVDRRVMTIGIANIIKLLITAGLNIFFVAVMDARAVGIIYGSMLGNLAYFVLLLFTTRRQLHFGFDTRMIRELLGYSVPLIPSFLMSNTRDMLSKYLVNTMFGTSSLGIYSIAERIAMPLKVIVLSLGRGYGPIKFEIMEHESNRERVYRALYSFIMAILCYLWVGLSLWGEEVLYLLATPEYYSAVPLIPPIAVVFVLDGAVMFLLTGIQSAKRPVHVPIVNGISLAVYALLGWYFGRDYGMMAVIYAGIVAKLALIVSSYHFSQKIMRIPYNNLGVFLNVFVSVVIVAAMQLISFESLGLRISIKALATVVVPAIYLWILSLFAVERGQIRSLGTKLMGKVRRT